MKAADWIDRVKTAKGWETDYRVGKELGISRALLSKYRNSTPTFDEDTAIKIAKSLGINPAGVILDQVAERTKDSLTRSTFSRVAGELCILCKVSDAIKMVAACARFARA